MGSPEVKKLLIALMLTTALIAPATAEAANVTVEVSLQNYGGPGAYLAVYVVDASGTYKQTLWVAGQKYRYLGALSGWARGFTNAGENSISGISGASVGSGQTLRVGATLSDALIDAGYKVVVDTAVENWGEYAAEASVPLQAGGSSASGQGFVSRLSVSM